MLILFRVFVMSAAAGGWFVASYLAMGSDQPLVAGITGILGLFLMVEAINQPWPFRRFRKCRT